MKYVPNSVSRTAARQILKTQKHSPEILFGLGVVGVVATVVTACKATLKVEDVLDEHAENLGKIRMAREAKPERYSERDAKEDKAKVYIKSSIALGRLYGPSLAIGAVSIGCLAGSHNILSKRNAGLAAAYAAVEKGFNDYRRRVIDDQGEEKDREYRYGSTLETVETVDEKGKTHKEQVRRIEPNGVSIYARFFDCTVEGNRWSPDPEYNRMFLTSQQNYWNDLLRVRGHVFLNEVYQSLGLDHSKAGAVVGWVLNEDGDNYIDFGMTRDTPAVREFINGHESAILLDFNVDGVIYDKI